MRKISDKIGKKKIKGSKKIEYYRKKLQLLPYIFMEGSTVYYKTENH